jgi:wyosine [tRNA(Phe)-imidazoG37] synthetase (radical SAM superfamily)
MDLIYGPISSARYGNSLGINLLGKEKACSYNCVYCHLGPSSLTMNHIRKDYGFAQIEQIKTDLAAYFAKNLKPDHLVVSGNGEPTLHPDFDDAMKAIVECRNANGAGVKIVVLSNGAHLDSKKVVAGLRLADERVIKFDAGSDAMMTKVNDPLVRVNVSKLLNAIGKLGPFTLQSLFCKGAVDNSTNEAIEEWIEIVGMLKPLDIQICTLSRESGVRTDIQALDEDSLYGIAFKLKKRTGLEARVFGAKKS